MENQMDSDALVALSGFFDPADIHWKPVAFTKDKSRAMVVAYVDRKAVLDRLDEAVGAANWKNEFTQGPDGGVVCGLSIRTGEGEWVTKWDGSDRTEIEAVKGGLTGALRRAASVWGIGRYLSQLPSPWVAIDQGRFENPPIPREFLPEGAKQQKPKKAEKQPPVKDAEAEARKLEGKYTPAQYRAKLKKLDEALAGMNPETLILQQLTMEEKLRGDWDAGKYLEDGLKRIAKAGLAARLTRDNVATIIKAAQDGEELGTLSTEYDVGEWTEAQVSYLNESLELAGLV